MSLISRFRQFEIRTVKTAMIMVAMINELDDRNFRKGGASASPMRVP
jgi:hypothetical protein